MKKKRIGIDASRAFSSHPTGIERYAFSLIEHLTHSLKEEEVTLYVRKNTRLPWKIPDGWRVKTIALPFFWTQIGLSWEMMVRSVDVLFVPSHVVPWVTPRKTVVTVHGLEFERISEGYSRFSRAFMRFFVRRSCIKASYIIAVSEHTKQDIMSLYGIEASKIQVVYEGPGFLDEKKQPLFGKHIRKKLKKSDAFILFVGRLEYRKNITRLIEAFARVKKQKRRLHKLVLAGFPGYGYEAIQKSKKQSGVSRDIVELGYIPDEEKQWLLKNTDVLVFTSLEEGFGLPILEAQQSGVPVVASDSAVSREIAGSGVFFADPLQVDDIAEKISYALDDMEKVRESIALGKENVKRFSWKKCAEEISSILKKECL